MIEFLEWFSKLDVIAGERHVLSIAAFAAMGLYTIKISRKRPLLAIFDAALFPYFFYTIMDFSNYVLWLSITGFVPHPIYPGMWLAAFAPTAFHVYKNRKLFNFKMLAATWPISVSFMLLTIAIFGTWNMRGLEGMQRAIFFIFSFVPMWAMWIVGYYVFAHN